MEAGVQAILIAGIESVVGANLAASLLGDCRVLGVSSSGPVPLAGCESIVSSDHEPEDLARYISDFEPDQVAYCGTAAASSWQSTQPRLAADDETEAVRRWAIAARDAKCRFTYISSDAVFTGPWLFHDEESSCLCDSPRAQEIRTMEATVLQTCPDALVVRTHVYGWLPPAAGAGWIESILADLEACSAGPFDYHCHAAPILATDFARILNLAWQARLDGVYHIAGAERVNPNQFVERLADEFALPGPNPVNGNCLYERPKGFGQGECSLHTHKIRHALHTSMPVVAEGLRRLREQKLNGYHDRFQPQRQPVHDRVA